MGGGHSQVVQEVPEVLLVPANPEAPVVKMKGNEIESDITSVKKD